MKDAAAAVAAPIWRIMRGQGRWNGLALVFLFLAGWSVGLSSWDAHRARMELSEAQAELTRVRFDTWVETVDMLERSGWGLLPIGDTIPVRYFRGIGDPYNTMMDSSAYMVQTDSYYWCEGTENGAGTTCSGEWTLRDREALPENWWTVYD